MRLFGRRSCERFALGETAGGEVRSVSKQDLCAQITNAGGSVYVLYIFKFFYFIHSIFTLSSKHAAPDAFTSSLLGNA